MDVFTVDKAEGNEYKTSFSDLLKDETEDIEKRLGDLEYICDKNFVEMYKNIKDIEGKVDVAEVKDAYFFYSIDNLLMLIAFLQNNILDLQESAFILKSELEALETAPLFKRVTQLQRQDILQKEHEKAKKIFAPLKEMGEKRIKDTMDSIIKRREEKQNDTD